jgi:hypothetical protein
MRTSSWHGESLKNAEKFFPALIIKFCPLLENKSSYAKFTGNCDSLGILH